MNDCGTLCAEGTLHGRFQVTWRQMQIFILSRCASEWKYSVKNVFYVDKSLNSPVSPLRSRWKCRSTVTCFDLPGYSNKSSSVLSRRTAIVSAIALSLEQSALRLLDQAKPVCVAKYSARVDGQSVLGAVEQLRAEMRSNRSPSDVVCDIASFSRSLRYCLIAFEAWSVLCADLSSKASWLLAIASPWRDVLTSALEMSYRTDVWKHADTSRNW